MSIDRKTVVEAIKDLMDLIEDPPPKDCRCHICPPCNDCVQYEHHREVLAQAKSVLAELEGA